MLPDTARRTRLPRFFVPASTLTGERVRLQDVVAHQLRHVLRARPGERIVLLDNTGQEFETVLDTVSSDGCEGHVVAQRPCANEPRLRLTLYAALLKHDKFEWLLQKGVELGVTGFQPMVTERCVTGQGGDGKQERWERIVREASEQSGRGIIPTLASPLGFAPAAAQAARTGLSLLPYENEHDCSLRSVLRGQTGLPAVVNLFIGPEGGFTPAEIELGRSHGLVSVTLGSRILRAETASLAAAAAVFYEYGEFG